MAETIPDISRAARARRQDDWQAGTDWCARERLTKRALAACAERTPYGQHLFLQGVAQTLTAAGRDVAGLDTRKGG